MIMVSGSQPTISTVKEDAPVQKQPMAELLPQSFQPPIFILGIAPRSGTNFLHDLISLHPDCGAGPIREDFLLHYADFLTQYTHQLSQAWQGWIDDPTLLEALHHCLGHSLTTFLNLQTQQPWLNVAIEKEPKVAQIFKRQPKRIVTKTPSVKNLDDFFKLFPDAHLLIVIRDGRTVAESFVKSFGGTYELAIREWRKGAESISNFMNKNNQKQSRYCIVKYEDLHTDTEAELRKIFTFLNLNATLYDFSSITKLPVRGSSVFRGQDSSLHWQPVEKTEDFNPNQRWENWSNFIHLRFNWLAGKYLTEFGYEKYEIKNNPYLFTIVQRLLDAKWWLVNKVKAILYFLGLRSIILKLKSFLSLKQFGAN